MTAYILNLHLVRSFLVFITGQLAVVLWALTSQVRVQLACLHTVQSPNGTPAQRAGWWIELKVFLFDYIARQLIEAPMCDSLHLKGLLARSNVFPLHGNVSFLCIVVFIRVTCRVDSFKLLNRSVSVLHCAVAEGVSRVGALVVAMVVGMVLAV